MDKVESAFLELENTKPWVWMRHIDDIFFIWTESENELEGFLQRLNAFHPNLKFTHEKSKVSITFLDVTVSINGEEFETDLYCKPTDCHQFLEFNSAHPIHNKKSIVYSKGLRIKRLCSKKDAFEKHLESLRSWFGKRGYTKKLVDNQIRRVLESKPEQLFESRIETGIGVPLVVTYHPRFHNLTNTIRKLFIYMLRNKSKRCFHQHHLYRSDQVSLRSYFVQKFIR